LAPVCVRVIVTGVSRAPTPAQPVQVPVTLVTGDAAGAVMLVDGVLTCPVPELLAHPATAAPAHPSSRKVNSVIMGVAPPGSSLAAITVETRRREQR
jgi:hypothetical protein